MSDQVLTESPAQTAVNRKALIASALAEIGSGKSIRSAAQARGLPTSTVRSAFLAAKNSSPTSLSSQVAALALTVQRLETRLAALETGRDAEETAAEVRLALDSIPPSAFDDLPGAEPGPPHSRMPSTKQPGVSGPENE